MTTLRGMTWSHPRGYDPMVACAEVWARRGGAAIAWDRRSLQDFESLPVRELARSYDLIVIDHPHVGQVTAEGCLAPLDVPGREAERAALAEQSVGRSYASYGWQGRQWAFPIDAAAQVVAWRPDLIATPPATWDAARELAAQGRVLLPLRPPHALMAFFTLAGNLGYACAEAPGADLIDRGMGIEVFDALREMAELVGATCLEMDPIAAAERMATDGEVACALLIYGYVSYALNGFRPHRLAFADIPAMGGRGPVGSALGGTGIAVSAFSQGREAATAFAYFVASAEVQRGAYAAAGGQPGNAAAWDDDDVNVATGDFYRATRATLEGAWVRPRHDGYMGFQAAAAARINTGLVERQRPQAVVDDLNDLFRRSFRPAGV